MTNHVTNPPKSYKLVYGLDPEAFEAEARQAVKDGWVPIGGVHMVVREPSSSDGASGAGMKYEFAQAMVNYTLNPKD